MSATLALADVSASNQSDPLSDREVGGEIFSSSFQISVSRVRVTTQGRKFMATALSKEES